MLLLVKILAWASFCGIMAQANPAVEEWIMGIFLLGFVIMVRNRLKEKLPPPPIQH